MQKQKTLLALGDIVHDRYRIEDVLGEGGFSTVYLIRDLQVPDSQVDEKAALFALKELRYQNRQEKARFVFEGEILKKLDHPALPHFYRLFEDHTFSRDFMLLEYIQGPNLEALRRQQPDKRFMPNEVLSIIQPIVEALSYLHDQQLPIMHRDVKPANIIVPGTGKGAVLVDFGIAKEYETDNTTTAVRHCSPGYSAPEQYSGYGTDPRTDIYGLGATCYTLLTGTTPADAFHRVTTLVSKKSDPLTPINAMVANVPLHIAQAVERAISIGREDRFSTVDELWLALNTPISIHNPPTGDTSSYLNISNQARNQEINRDPKRGKSALFISFCLAFLIILGGALGFWSYIRHNSLTTSMSSSHSSRFSKSSTLTPSPSESTSYSRIKNAYRGTVHDLRKDDSTEMMLAKISQNNERINGSFTGLNMSGNFTGVLDSSQHIFFTVKGNASHSPLFFEGAIRVDGNLAGNYCDVDPAGQCTGNYGLWSVVPITP